jgi:hypothetical protein
VSFNKNLFYRKQLALPEPPSGLVTSMLHYDDKFFEAQISPLHVGE